MDEADFLGDRIAIMSKGSLKCCGSPLFLKSKYGDGYSLVITKNKLNENEEKPAHLEEAAGSFVSPASVIIKSATNTSKTIEDLVKNMIPNAKISSNINSEISFILPTEETEKFSGLFERLEKEKEHLDILNIGISVTTLEEVFLR